MLKNFIIDPLYAGFKNKISNLGYGYDAKQEETSIQMDLAKPNKSFGSSYDFQVLLGLGSSNYESNNDADIVNLQYYKNKNALLAETAEQTMEDLEKFVQNAEKKITDIQKTFEMYQKALDGSAGAPDKISDFLVKNQTFENTLSDMLKEWDVITTEILKKNTKHSQKLSGINEQIVRIERTADSGNSLVDKILDESKKKQENFRNNLKKIEDDSKDQKLLSELQTQKELLENKISENIKNIDGIASQNMNKLSEGLSKLEESSKASILLTNKILEETDAKQSIVTDELERLKNLSQASIGETEQLLENYKAEKISVDEKVTKYKNLKNEGQKTVDTYENDIFLQVAEMRKISDRMIEEVQNEINNYENITEHIETNTRDQEWIIEYATQHDVEYWELRVNVVTYEKKIEWLREKYNGLYAKHSEDASNYVDLLENYMTKLNAINILEKNLKEHKFKIADYQKKNTLLLADIDELQNEKRIYASNIDNFKTGKATDVESISKLQKELVELGDAKTNAETELLSELQSINAEKGTLIKSTIGLTQTIKDLNLSIERLTNLNLEKARRIEVLEAAKKKLSEDLEIDEKRLIDENKLKEENLKRKFEAQIEENTSKRKITEEELQNKIQELKVAEESLKTTESEKMVLLSKYTSEITTLQKQLKLGNEEVAKKENAIKNLKQANNNLTEINNTLKFTNAKLNSDLKTQNENNELRERELKRLKDENTNLADAIRAKTAEITINENNLKKKGEEYIATSGELLKLKNSFVLLQDKYDAIQKNFDEQTAELDTLNAEHKDLETSSKEIIEKTKAIVEKLTEKNARMENNMTAASERIDLLNSKLGKYLESIVELDEYYQNKLKTFDNLQIGDYKQKKLGFVSDSEKTKMELSELEKSVAQYQEKIQQNKIFIEEQEKTLDVTRDIKTTLDEKISKITSQLDFTFKKLDKFKSRIESLKLSGVQALQRADARSADALQKVQNSDASLVENVIIGDKVKIMSKLLRMGPDVEINTFFDFLIYLNWLGEKLCYTFFLQLYIQQELRINAVTYFGKRKYWSDESQLLLGNDLTDAVYSTFELFYINFQSYKVSPQDYKSKSLFFKNILAYFEYFYNNFGIYVEKSSTQLLIYTHSEEDFTETKKIFDNKNNIRLNQNTLLRIFHKLINLAANILRTLKPNIVPSKNIKLPENTLLGDQKSFSEADFLKTDPNLSQVRKQPFELGIVDVAKTNQQSSIYEELETISFSKILKNDIYTKLSNGVFKNILRKFHVPFKENQKSQRKNSLFVKKIANWRNDTTTPSPLVPKVTVQNQRMRSEIISKMISQNQRIFDLALELELIVDKKINNDNNNAGFNVKIWDEEIDSKIKDSSLGAWGLSSIIIMYALNYFYVIITEKPRNISHT